MSQSGRGVNFIAPLFEFDGKSIYIPAADLYLDARKKSPFGYISHAHGDHIANHEKTICTPETADLLKLRVRNPKCITIPYFQKTIWKDTQITLYPAGHILGSAQILIETKQGSLLYTGDFKTYPSHTVQNFVPVSADIVIMETTFGKSQYCFPSRDETEKELIALVKSKLEQNIVPVVYAYSLGKGQEALYLLTHSGLTVAVDYSIQRFCRIYEKYGVKFGDYEKLDKEDVKGRVVLLSAHNRSGYNLNRFGKTYSIYLSGWGIDENARYRFRVDHALPFSDHSDYNELIDFVDAIRPKQVYCTHGFSDIVQRINSMGIMASYLHDNNIIRVSV